MEGKNSKILKSYLVSPVLAESLKKIKSEDNKKNRNSYTDANPQNATHRFTWKGCSFWVVATWREYEILKKIFIVNEI